ncbi:S-layer homology domain-containing protein [Paenibacillus sp. GCM10012307]|uniref:S-layer homology domain-containing protein n=1 Tax=Paenibacillus roseus TaxID=2798579 RepID=A0A934J4D8_9BACL|nr:DUF4430 domain-containing protein [Paenibacillus roseus]MBJ6360606.1 S-layer homology domain-containing protein [Paenibacillus roseus]
MKLRLKWRASAALMMAWLYIFSTLTAPVAEMDRAFAAGGDAVNPDVAGAIGKVSSYLLAQSKIYDWQAIGLTRAGKQVPASYKTALRQDIAELYKPNAPKAPVTDYARLALAASAVIGNATDASGYNLIESIYNSDIRELNAAVFALIAYDSKSYTVPEDAKASRANLLKLITDKQLADGSFGLGIDMTAMALTGIATYKDQPEIKTAADKIVAWLKSSGRGVDAESIAQTIIGLTSYGVDPTSADFTSNGVNLVQQLLEYQNSDGSFSHLIGQAANGLATEQALQALVAYDLFTKNEGPLYRFPDQGTPVAPNVSLTVEGPQGPVTSGEAKGFNALAALKSLLQEKSIAYTVKQSSGGSYEISIDKISEGLMGGDDGWMFAVQRESQLLFPDGSMADFVPESNDRIIVYYGDYSATRIVSSVTTDPVEPQDEQPFTLTVLATGRVWDAAANQAIIEEKPAAGVKIQIGDISLTTGTDGKAKLEEGLPAGSYDITITGYRESAVPSIVRSTSKLKVAGQVMTTSHYRIEGIAGEIISGEATGKNVYQAVENLLNANRIYFEYEQYSFGKLITSINNESSNSNIGYWNFAVHRDGHWIYPDVGMEGFQPLVDDKIVVYLSGTETQLVNSATVLPAVPKSGQPFKVLVQSITWIWDNDKNANVPVTGLAAGAEVQIGNYRAVTDAEGIAQFAGIEAAGSYELTVTGYNGDKAPLFVRHVSTMKVTGLPKTTNTYRVEGPKGAILAPKITTAYSALEGLLAALQAENIRPHVKHSIYGSYIDSISGIDAGSYGVFSGWNYAIRRGGEWIYPPVGIGEFSLHNQDEVVVYFGDFTTQLPGSIIVSPAQPQGGATFNVAVTKLQWDWNASEFISSKASGVLVEAGGKSATTNGNGIATFAGGLPSGSYTMTISQYTDQSPGIVRMEKSLTVVSYSPGGGGEVTETVSLSVTGHSKKGTIIGTTSTRLEQDDTAYSVLKRILDEHGISHAKRGSGDSLYVSGIDGLSEGFSSKYPRSGWKYAVNGSYPNISAAAYKLRANDSVAWCYTLNGEDCDSTTSVDDTPSSSGGGNQGSGSGGNSEPKTVNEGFALLSLPANNELPLDRVGQTTVVLNAKERMSASVAEQLRKTLESNQVKMEKEFTSGSEATLSDSKDEVKLTVPAGAVAEKLTIKVEELQAEGTELVSGIYRFTPAGTKFRSPVTIQVKVPVLTNQPDQLVLAWLNEATGQWIPVPAVIDAKTGTLTGKTDHFTKYAVIDRSKVPGGIAGKVDVSKEIDAAVKQVLGKEQLSDWEVLALARAGKSVPAGYLQDVVKQVQDEAGTFTKVTDAERIALAVKAAGGDPTRLGGYNLIASIYNHDRMTNQGANGPAFALIALDSGRYEVPATAKWNRDKLIDWLLGVQNADGGFPLAGGSDSDVDITAMVLASFAPYQDRVNVKAATDKALRWLSAAQHNNGEFAAFGDENSESASQVIIALAALGINPKDARFTKSGRDVLSNLLAYRNADGGFAHVKGEKSNGMATEQALLALVAYKRYAEGAAPLYALIPAAEEPTARFVDDAAISDWAAASVYEALEKGIMNGVSAKELRFAPRQAMTRAEFAALLIKLTGQTADNNAKQVFSDVLPGSWYYGSVMKARELGYLQGVTPREFKPDQAVSRQEMAIMIARAFDLQAGAQPVVFKDSAELYKNAAVQVQAVYEQGIMTGYNGRFEPRAAVTREMAAVVAVKLSRLAS